MKTNEKCNCRRNKQFGLFTLIITFFTIISIIIPNKLEVKAASTATYDKIINEDQKAPNGFDKTSGENPYGYSAGQPFLLSEENELLTYKSYDIGEKDGGTWISSREGKSGEKTGNVSDGFGSHNYYSSGPMSQCSFIQSVSFDPSGSGRRDHVAFVGLARNHTMNVWVLNTATNSWSNAVSLGNASWITDDVGQYQAMNFLSITAGDYNGSSRDTIVVYACLDGSSFGLFELTCSNLNLSIKAGKNQTMLHNYYKNSSFSSNTNKRDKLCATLDTGDLNHDGIDDLVALSYVGDMSSDSQVCDMYRPYLGVAMGSRSSGSAIARTYELGVWSQSGKSDGVTSYNSLLAPGLAVGNIDQDNNDEIIVAGMLNKITSKKDSDTANTPINMDKTKLCIASYDVTNTISQKNFSVSTDSNVWTQDTLWIKGTTADKIWPQTAVEAVAINGDANEDFLFIAGDLYNMDMGNPSAVCQPEYFTEADDAFGGGSGDAVSVPFIQSVATGNFNGNDYGYQQVVFTLGYKVSSRHKYYYSTAMIGDKGHDSVTGITSGYYCTTKKSIENDYSVWFKDDDLNLNLNYFVTAIDNDQDGILAKYSGKSYAYSDPQVLSILQASPWFEELDGYDSGETSYSFSQSYDYTKGTSNSTSFGAGFAMELMGTVGGFELQTGYATDWSKSFEETLTVSTTDTFSAKATDTVILYRTPVYIYSYDVLNTSGTWNKGGISISVPKKPSYQQMSVSDYNGFADYYNKTMENKSSGSSYTKLESIGDNLYLGNEGSPFDYYQADQSGTLNPTILSQSTYSLGYNGGSTASGYVKGNSTTTTEEMSHGFTFDLTVKFGFDGGFVSAYAGGYASLQYMSGSSVSETNANETGVEGIVCDLNSANLIKQGIPRSVIDRYGFNWQLAKWDSNLIYEQKDNPSGIKTQVPVYGYVLSNLKSAPAAPKNLSAEPVSTDTVNLSWNSGSSSEYGFNIYLVNDGEYILQNAEPVTDTTYDASGLRSNRTHTFVVTSLEKDASGNLIEGLWSSEASALTPKKAYQISITGEHAQVEGNTYVGSKPFTDSSMIQEETMVYFKATPDENYTLTHIFIKTGSNPEEELLSSNGTFSFMLIDDTVVRAVAEPIIKDRCKINFEEETLDGTDNITGTTQAFTTSGAFHSGALISATALPVTFTAHPSNGYVLKSWDIDGTEIMANGEASYVFNPTKNEHSIKAVFVQENDPVVNKTITIQPASGGEILLEMDGKPLSLSEGKVEVPVGVEVTFKSSPKKYYSLSQWTGAFNDVSYKTTEFKSKIISDVTVGAVFSPTYTYTINYDVNDKNAGSIIGENNIKDGDSVLPDSDISIKLKAASGKRIEKCIVTRGKSSKTITFDTMEKEYELQISNIDEEITVQGFFKNIESARVSLSSGFGGILNITRPRNPEDSTSLGDVIRVYDGSDIYYKDALTIRADCETGYEIDSLTVNGTDVKNGEIFTYDGTEKNVAIAASYRLKKYKLTLPKTTSGGTIQVEREDTPLKNGDSITHFDLLKIIATPDPYYELSYLKVNGKSYASNDVIQVNADVNIEYSFRDTRVIQPTKLSLTPLEKKMFIGENYTLTPKLQPDNATLRTIHFTSSDPSIAQVSQTGEVLALMKGVCTITAQTENGLLASSTFTVIAPTTVLEANRSGAKEVTLKWTKTKNADGYDIYGVKCDGTFRLIKEVKNKTSYKVTKIAKKDLTAYAYKFYVKSFCMVNGKKVYLNKSKNAHVRMFKSSTYDNAKRVRLKKKSVSLTLGKTTNLKPIVVIKKGKKQMNHEPAIRYLSTDPTIASVSSKGIVTAKQKGSCFVYAIALNGKCTKANITVK